ncbi:hypothetical protein [Croceibacter atlanticus]|uniref:hypothetical protein n=1 Tax=Croceibacter atlanticus TaxID=313588 RepID=UPI0023538429|nr:hypothetical protein [Croceibacter atlanticus]|tara:strand:+ start:1248 stop:1748 length:501 start_codon:yes stop_codon:yes gene_type:complete
MKNLYLITVLTLFSLTVNAQDASNDATWEETIEFLDGKLKLDVIDRGIIHFGYEGLFYPKSITINSKYIHLKGGFRPSNRVGTEYGKEIKIPLIKYHKNLNERPNVKLVSKAIEIEFDNSKLNYDNFYFWIDDKELEPRITKAFQHLAYLATKKREDERKKSGSKF